MTIKGDPTLAEQVLSNRAAQEQLAESAPDHPARAFGEAVEAGAPAEAWPSSSDIGAVAARVAEAVLPQLVEHLVPVCVSKFQGALEKIWAAQERSQRDMLEKMLQAVLAQQLGASPQRPIVNANCSARRAL